MITVQNFLLVDKQLLPLDKFRGQVPDPLYIEGAILLEINGTQVMTLEMWDMIDQLWAYIVQGLQDIQEQNTWRTYFPDQPLELSFKTDARKQVITIETNPDSGRLKATASYSEFVETMTNAARAFFLLMKDKVPTNRSTYDSSLKDLEALMLQV